MTDNKKYKMYKIRLKRFISFEDLIKLDDEQKILVSRIFINSRFAYIQLKENIDKENFNKEEFYKIAKIHKRLLDADKKNRSLPVWGIQLSVKEIKEAFSTEDIGKSRTYFRLPFNHEDNKSKEKNPMDLNTGEELYEYLKDKTDEEIEDYFVSRGAIVEDDIMLNNGLSTLYRIEKEANERQANEEDDVSYFDGEDDGLER